MADQFDETFLAFFEDEFGIEPGLPVKLMYRKSDPLALAFIFEEYGVEREWLVSRDLIGDVILKGVSQGEVNLRIDLRTMPGCGCRGVRFHFVDRYGWQDATFHYGEIYTVIGAAFMMVPQHQESAYINIDSFIDEVLKG